MSILDLRPSISKEAHEVHESALIVDLHADTPKFMSRGYDFYKKHDPGSLWYRTVHSIGGHLDLPRMKAGNLSAQFFTCWTFPLPERGCAKDVNRQLDAMDAAAHVGGMADGKEGGLVLCTEAEEVSRCKERGQIAALTGIEGGQALEGSAEELRRFAERGVRYLGLLHFSKNALGYPARGLGQDPSKGLTALGNEIVDLCHELGVLVDLAHINRRGFFDALSRPHRAAPPLIVSHTGVAGVQPHWRNIDDEQIRAIADRGGVIGIIFAPKFLGGDGVNAVVAHLLHVIKIGGEDVVALGSDWDGFVRPPTGLAHPAELPNLTQALLSAGVTPEVIHKLLGGNVMRVLSMAPHRGGARGANDGARQNEGVALS